MIRSVVLVGRGAVGTVYAAALAATQGVAFRVGVDATRKERYAKEPFLFNGNPLAFNYFTPQQGERTVDLIILATKWGGYADALALIEPLVGPNTLVLPLLNGLAAYRVAVERWGEDRVLRGFYIGHTASRDAAGNIAQDGSYRTVFGEKTNTAPYSARVASIAELFDRAGIKYRIPENMEGAQWQKFVLNIGTNQPTGLYNMNYGELSTSVEAMTLSKNLMQEAQTIAVALGVDGAEQLASNALEGFSILAPQDYSSMAQDVRAGRSTEIEIFAGEVLRLGAVLGIETPHHQALYGTMAPTLK